LAKAFLAHLPVGDGDGGGFAQRETLATSLRLALTAAGHLGVASFSITPSRQLICPGSSVSLLAEPKQSMVRPWLSRAFRRLEISVCSPSSAFSWVDQERSKLFLWLGGLVDGFVKPAVAAKSGSLWIDHRQLRGA